MSGDFSSSFSISVVDFRAAMLVRKYIKWSKTVKQYFITLAQESSGFFCWSIHSSHLFLNFDQREGSVLRLELMTFRAALAYSTDFAIADGGTAFLFEISTVRYACVSYSYFVCTGVANQSFASVSSKFSDKRKSTIVKNPESTKF